MIRLLVLGLVLAAAPAFAAPCAGFDDVDDSSPFCSNVAWIKNRNVTLGCTSATTYCPGDAVNRLAMAAFLNRLGDVLLPPNVLWVAPAGGMFQSIQAAIDYAAALPAEPRRLVKVAPGTYAEAITMASSVDVEGSGKDATIIDATVCGTGTPTSATVIGASNSQLRNVTVRARSNAPSNSECALVYLHDVNGTPLRDVAIEFGVTGSSIAYGVIIDSSPLSTYAITLENVSIGSFAVGGAAIGILATGRASFPFTFMTFRDVRFAHTADVSTGIGLRLVNAVATLDRTAASIGSGSSSAGSIGVLVEGTSASVTVERSWLRVPGSIFGPGGMFATVAAPATLRIAHSLVEGGASGTMTCFQNYDAGFAPVAC